MYYSMEAKIMLVEKFELPLEKWPYGVAKYYWQTPLGMKNRFVIWVFLYTNGVAVKDILEFFSLHVVDNMIEWERQLDWLCRLIRCGDWDYCGWHVELKRRMVRCPLTDQLSEPLTEEWKNLKKDVKKIHEEYHMKK